MAFLSVSIFRQSFDTETEISDDFVDTVSETSRRASDHD